MWRCSCSRVRSASCASVRWTSACTSRPYLSEQYYPSHRDILALAHSKGASFYHLSRDDERDTSVSRNNTHIHRTNEAFICAHCGRTVAPPLSGTAHRNHCPYCLCSLHVDVRPGDRRSGCRGLMKAIGVWVQLNGEWSVLHRCDGCGLIRPNRIAADDDETALLALAARPLSKLPFPLEMLLSPRREPEVRRHCGEAHSRKGSR